MLLDRGGVLLWGLAHLPLSTVFQRLSHLLAETVLLDVLLIVGAALWRQSHVTVETPLITHCAVAHDICSVLPWSELVARVTLVLDRVQVVSVQVSSRDDFTYPFGERLHSLVGATIVVLASDVSRVT